MPKDVGGSDNRAAVEHAGSSPAIGETKALRARGAGRSPGGTGSRPARLAPIAVGEASEGLVARRLQVHPSDVVFVKGIVEASEGLAGVFAAAGGELTIAAPLGREADLARLLDDLARELGSRAELRTADTSHA